MLEGSLDPPPSPFHARELQARIDAALERVPATWGVLVHSTTLGDLAIREPDAALVPASCVKLFTAMAALHATHLYGRHLVLQYAEQEKSVEAMREKLRAQMEVAEEAANAGAPGKRKKKGGPTDELDPVGALRL